jgi:Cu/Ag efflux pump CusA
VSYNASKGAKLLEIWLESKYCKDKGITKDNVALVVKEALENKPLLK